MLSTMDVGQVNGRGDGLVKNLHPEGGQRGRIIQIPIHRFHFKGRP
jgi:hypothetical protein